MAMYAQTSGTHSTTSGTFEAIPGLSITIPEGVGAMAIVILNLPQPYSTGNNYPGGVFRVSIDGKVNDVEASFTYSEQNPPGSGRVPTTLLVGVPLGPKAAGHPGPVAWGTRQQGYHRQPRDVDGDPRLEATVRRRKDKAGIDAGLVLFAGRFWPALMPALFFLAVSKHRPRAHRSHQAARRG